MRKLTHKPAKGFSLVEMLISLLVLWLVMAVIIAAVAKFQQSHRSTDARTQLHQDARAALELISQEAGQAGLVNSRMAGTLADNGAPATVATATTCTTSCPASLTVNSIAYLFAHEQVYVGTGTSWEGPLTISSISGTTVTFTSNTTKTHAVGDPVVSYGVFPNGISYAATNANSSKLLLIGDIYGGSNVSTPDDNLYQVVYQWCDTTGAQCPPTSGIGPLTRKITSLLGTQHTTIATLLPNVTACAFTLTTQHNTVQPAWAASAITMVQSASVSVTVRTPYVDRYTGQYIYMTHSMLNIQPRNMIAAYKQWQTTNDGTCATGTNGTCVEMQNDNSFTSEICSSNQNCP
jgi:Tfp pilus assembly protein PilV